MKKFLLVMLMLVVPSFSYGKSAVEVTKGVQKKYETIKTLEADFVQTALSVGMNKGNISSGKVRIKKPGKMRWDFQKPVDDIVVSNGKTMWVYQKDLNQVIETGIEENTPQVAMNFLAGAGNLEDDFKVELTDTTTEYYELKLSPKERIPHISEIKLLVNKKTFVVMKTSVKDAFGGETSVEIKNISINKDIMDSAFEYVAPKGVTVMKP